MSAFVMLLAAALGAAAALIAARCYPRLLGGATLSHPAVDADVLWRAAALLFAGALWTALMFWSGTKHAPLTCAQVGAVADALEGTNISVRAFNRSVDDLSDALLDMRGRADSAYRHPRPGATGGP